jgi:hypothetical protein
MFAMIAEHDNTGMKVQTFSKEDGEVTVGVKNNLVTIFMSLAEADKLAADLQYAVANSDPQD